MQHKYHFIYKTTCLVDGRFYYGVHSTDDINDGYLGSGVELDRSRKKHGDDQHRREIIMEARDRDDAMDLEASFVTKERIAHPLCMNLIPGGSGGWGLHNQNPLNREHRVKGALAANRSPKRLESEAYRQNRSNAMRERHRQGTAHAPDWTGRQHRAETKAKIGATNSLKQSGPRNSQYGKRWAHNPTTGEARLFSAPVEFVGALLAGWKSGRK